jgi:hypothetical protein
MLFAWRTANLLAIVAILVLEMAYIGKTWSPSSYGHVLVRHLGYADGGPDVGKLQLIRSDEWAVVTPLTQATVNNHFERYNRTSLYGEDLRMNSMSCRYATGDWLSSRPCGCTDP